MTREDYRLKWHMWKMWNSFLKYSLFTLYTSLSKQEKIKTHFTKMYHICFLLCICHHLSILYFGKGSRLIEQENVPILSPKLLVPSINSHYLGNILICVVKLVVNPLLKFMSSHFLCLLFTLNNIDKPIRCWQFYCFSDEKSCPFLIVEKGYKTPLMRFIWFLISNKCKTQVHLTKKK